MPGPRVVFAVSVRAADGQEALVAAGASDPLHVPADRLWRDVDVDLGPWAGRDVELVLRVDPTPGTPPIPDRAGWARPRIVPGPCER
jgi:hypothetical protein